jgi:hypothetical protein
LLSPLQLFNQLNASDLVEVESRIGLIMGIVEIGIFGIGIFNVTTDS